MVTWSLNPSARTGTAAVARLTGPVGCGHSCVDAHNMLHVGSDCSVLVSEANIRSQRSFLQIHVQVGSVPLEKKNTFLVTNLRFSALLMDDLIKVVSLSQGHYWIMLF